MKILYSKRGNLTDLITQPIIKIIIIFLLIYPPLQLMINTVGDNKSFEKNFYARDIALLVDTLELLPGNMIVDYTVKEEFDFELDENEVRVYEKGIDLYFGRYGFIEDKNIKIDYKKISIILEKGEEEKRLIFSKLGNEINFNEKGISSEKISKISCSDIGTKGDIKKKKVYLDGDEKINGYLRNSHFINQVVTEVKDADLVLSVNKEENDARVYINDNSANKEKSRKLACLILNQFSQYFENTQIMLDISGKDILNTNRVAVYLEVGEVDDDKASIAIYEGVKEYYE